MKKLVDLPLEGHMKTIAQRLKFTATTLAASCLTLGMAGNAVADSSLDTIMERGEIRIGVYDGFKPWAFRSPDGDIEGITIDIAKSIAETLDVDLKLVVVNSTNRTQFLRQKRIDVVMAGLYDSLQHRKNADSIL